MVLTVGSSASDHSASSKEVRRRSNMRRVVLLAIVAMGLPSLALADSFDFNGNTPLSLTGSFSTSLNAETNLTSVNGSTTGVSGTIDLITGTLSKEKCAG